MKKNTVFEYILSRNIEYYENESVKPYLTIGIGNKVRCIIIVKEEAELIHLIKIMVRDNYKFVLIGGGSNTIFAEHSPDLFVIINKINKIEQVNNNILLVNSGVLNRELLDWCKKKGFGGLEFLAGIPGTIGGAFAVNAGAFGKAMSDVVNKADVYLIREGLKRLSNNEFGFEYRESKLKYKKDIVIKLFLNVKKSSYDEINKKIINNLKQRSSNNPGYNEKTAGCFFKNPIISGKKVSAGKLIERSGLKGEKFSDIMVSDIHANFIINTQNADFDNIINAEKKIIEQTKIKTGIKLEREVIYIMSDGSKK